MYKVLIRPLEISDAQISWKWRNDPKIWMFTGSAPKQKITPEIEYDWIQKALADHTTKRFAILVDDLYVGNIQLTNIINYDTAEYHIFIGDTNYWGKGVAQLATYQILYYAKEVLGLKNIFLKVRKENGSAIIVYKKNGFAIVSEDKGWLSMNCNILEIEKPTVSIFVMVYNHEAFLKECLNGLLMQKCSFSFEIVVGEDFSTDNSRKILIDYQNRYPGKFKLLLHDKNIGAAANQLAVLKNCTGKFIAMCEGDDYWTDINKLQKQVIFLERNVEVVISGHKVDIMNNENVIEQVISKDYSPLELNFAYYYHTSTIVFRNVVVHYPEEMIGVANGDSFLISILGYYGSGHFHSEIMPSVYRLHEGGAYSSSDAVYRFHQERNSFIKLYYYHLGKQNLIVSHYFKKQYLNSFKKLWVSRSVVDSVKLIWEVYKNCVFNLHAHFRIESFFVINAQVVIFFYKKIRKLRAS